MRGHKSEFRFGNLSALDSILASKGSKGTLRPDFQASTRPRLFFKANVTTRYRKTVVRNSRYNHFNGPVS